MADYTLHRRDFLLRLSISISLLQKFSEALKAARGSPLRAALSSK